MTPNAAVVVNGGTISNGRANFGGGIWIENGSSVYLRNSVTVKQNRGHGGSGDQGGGIYNNGYLQVLDSVFEDNESTNGGGAVTIGSLGQARFVNALFKGNSATGNGGAILNLGLLTVIDSTFEDNTAGLDEDPIFSALDSITVQSNNMFL